jgi:hypothetical protein
VVPKTRNQLGENFGLPALGHAPALSSSKVIVKLQYNRISIANMAWPAPAQRRAATELVRKWKKAYELPGATRADAGALSMAVGWADGRVRHGP